MTTVGGRTKSDVAPGIAMEDMSNSSKHMQEESRRAKAHHTDYVGYNPRMEITEADPTPHEDGSGFLQLQSNRKLQPCSRCW